MVSLNPLKGKSCWKGIVFWGLIVAILMGTSVWLYLQHVRNDSPQKVLIPSWPTIAEFERDDLDKENELGKFAETVIEAYTNSNVEIMQQRFNELMEKSRRLSPHSYSRVIGGISRCLKDNFLKGDIGFHCQNKEQFKKYMEVNRTLIVLFGRAEDQRHFYTTYTMGLEMSFLERLYNFRSYCQKQNLVDFLNEIDLLVKEWVERIDSHEGMSRKYILWDFELNLELVRRGMDSREHLVHVYHSCVGHLKSLLGRDPKWIDEIK